jgi:type IV pilus assembly protein PilA
MKRLNRCSRSKGFTLIELMITITIVAILVAMAVPAYSDYTIRSKVIECINKAAVAKVSLSEYRQTLGDWPPDMSQAGLTTAGNSKYCTAFINYVAGTGEFTIDVNEAAIDGALTADSIAPVMKPTATSSGQVHWTCMKGTTSAANLKYLPATCRES